jgi:hypothetical protein
MDTVMAFLIKRTLLFGLMLLINACVLHPHPLYSGGYGGGSYYDRGYGRYYDGGGHHGSHRHSGDGYHDGSHH